MVSPVEGDPNRCTLTKVECVDPNGSLPKWLVAKASPLRALMAEQASDPPSVPSSRNLMQQALMTEPGRHPRGEDPGATSQHVTDTVS